jgi:hypothetical protein
VTILGARGVASHVKQLVERSNSVSGPLHDLHVRKPSSDIRPVTVVRGFRQQQGLV